jgi:hypothetical protein
MGAGGDFRAASPLRREEGGISRSQDFSERLGTADFSRTYQGVGGPVSSGISDSGAQRKREEAFCEPSSGNGESVKTVTKRRQESRFLLINPDRWSWV